MAKSVDHYNNYVISRNIEGVTDYYYNFVYSEAEKEVQRKVVKLEEGRLEN